MKKKKVMAAMCALAMVFGSSGGLPISGLRLFDTAVTASAESDFIKNAENTTLKTSGISAPTASDSTWTGSFVYYGNYNGSPVKYRVLDPKTNYYIPTILLDCDTLLYSAKFNTNSNNAWSTSSVKTGLNGDAFLNKDGVFTESERNAIAKCYISAGDGLPSSEEQVFLLGTSEANNSAYGYSSDSARKKGSFYVGYEWWLRSPSGSGFADIVDYYGSIGGKEVDEERGVSPAFNVNMESIMFSTAISETNTNGKNSYKLTLKDTSLTVETNGDLTRTGDTVTVPYTKSDNADTVSVLITDKEWSDKSWSANGATILQYEPLTVTTAGTGTFTLSSSLPETYYAYLLAEDVNGEKQTDYASTLVKIDIPNEKIDPTYTITIPATVSIDGGTAEFTAENVTLPDGSKINISIDGSNTENSETTFNAMNDAKNSTVHYTINNGTADVSDGGTALTFTEDGTQTLTLTKTSEPTYAGTHTEVLTFGIAVE